MSMQIIDWNEFLQGVNASALTIGVFDGVHLGHQELIREIVKMGPCPTVISFRENPRKLISPESFEGEIYSLKQKISAIQKLGILRLVLIDFSYEFSKIKGRDFIDLLIDSGKMLYMAIGSNFRCGFRHELGAESIKEINMARGIGTGIIKTLYHGGEALSSSRIRSLILSGDLRQASVLMGRNFELDLSGMDPVLIKSLSKANERFCYDLASTGRIVPPDGTYSVLLKPLKVEAYMEKEANRIFLPAKAEMIEFI